MISSFYSRTLFSCCRLFLPRRKYFSDTNRQWQSQCRLSQWIDDAPICPSRTLYVGTNQYNAEEDIFNIDDYILRSRRLCLFLLSSIEKKDMDFDPIHWYWNQYKKDVDSDGTLRRHGVTRCNIQIFLNLPHHVYVFVSRSTLVHSFVYLHTGIHIYICI